MLLHSIGRGHHAAEVGSCTWLGRRAPCCCMEVLGAALMACHQHTQVAVQAAQVELRHPDLPR